MKLKQNNNLETGVLTRMEEEFLDRKNVDGEN